MSKQSQRYIDAIASGPAQAHYMESLSTVVDEKPIKLFFVYVTLLKAACNQCSFDSVMDLGCATGNLSRLFSTISNTVIGLDMSEVFIDVARKRSQNISNIEYYVTDATNVEEDRILSRKYDLIIMRGFPPLNREIYSGPEEAIRNHIKLLENYTNLLSEKGVVLIDNPSRKLHDQYISLEYIRPLFPIVTEGVDPDLYTAVNMMLLSRNPKAALKITKTLSFFFHLMGYGRNICLIGRKPSPANHPCLNTKSGEA